MSGPWAVAVLVLWVLVVALAVLVLGLLRRVGPVLERAERALAAGGYAEHDVGGLPDGAAVPAATVTDLAGRRVDLADVGPADRVLLFVAADCPACVQLTDDLLASPLTPGLPLVVVAGSDTDAGHYRALADRGVPVVGQPDGAASAAYAQQVFPFATAVSAGTVRATTVPGTAGDIARLAAGPRARPDGGSRPAGGHHPHEGAVHDHTAHRAG